MREAEAGTRRGRRGGSGGWAREPRPTERPRRAEKVASHDRAPAVPTRLLQGPPAQPGPAGREGSATHLAERGAATAPAGSPEKSCRGRRERARRPLGSSSRPRRLVPGSRRSREAGSAPTRRRVADRPAGRTPSGAQTRQVQLPRRPAPRRLSGNQGRPALAGLAPQRHGHLALPRDPPAPRAARGATPPNSRPATPAAAGLRWAPLGSAPPTGPCRSPGQPRLQRDAWRPTRGASAAQLVRPPPARGAAHSPAPSASAGTLNR